MGNTLTRVAHPLTTIEAPPTAALIGEWQPAQLVIGLPVHADGTPHAMTARAKAFARALEARFALPVALVDERFTTQAARSALASAGLGGRTARVARDEAAAQII